MKHTNPDLSRNSGPCRAHGCTTCAEFVPAAYLSDGWPVCAQCGHTQHVHSIGDRVVPVCDTVPESRSAQQSTTKKRNRTMATKKEAAPKKAAADEKGTAWLTGVVNDKLGTDYTSYQLRIVIRRLVKQGALERGEGRYSFTGVNDPQVKAIVAAIKNGAAEDAKKERIEKAKETAEKKPAARRSRKKADEDEAPAKPARRTRKKAEPEPVEDDDDLDLDEL